MKSGVFLVLPLLAAVTGCSPYRYHAVTVQPEALARSLETRSLDDPALKAWMKQAANFEPSEWPMAAWNLQSLTLAAYYYSTDLDLARANAAVSAAAIQTAAMKPNPSIGLSAGYESAAESPYLLGFDFSLPIETAGKRGYRVAEATRLSEASQIEVAEAAWKARSRVRAALVELLIAEKSMGLLHTQESQQGAYLALLESRLRAGEISLPEVAAARIDLTNVRQALYAAEGQTENARAALAAALCLPASVLADKTIVWAKLDQPPPVSTLSAKDIRTSAVVNRLDVQRALKQYEAAQARLQLEVARQYPDIDLGPGYAFEEGVHLIPLKLGTVLPLRNRNEGPIAEAEAQRKAAGAQLLAVQSTVMADCDRALTQYTAVEKVLEETSLATAQTVEQSRTADRLFHAGETDQLAQAVAAIQATQAERAQLEALHQMQIALGALEDALERPLDSETAPALPKNAPRQ